MKKTSKTAFFLAQLNNKVIDLLISPKTTLPWLVASVPGGAWLLPLLAPLRESGSMLPQWWIQRTSPGRHTRRDLGWRFGLVIQLFGVIGFAVTGFLVAPEYLPMGVLISLIILSSGRAFTSVFSKDLQAQIVERQSRGKFTGALSSVSGLLSIIFALLLVSGWFSESRALINMGFIVVVFTVLLALILSFSIVCEKENQTPAPDISIIKQVKSSSLLKHMIISRCLLLHAMLAIPIVTILLGSEDKLDIGWLMLASGLASLTASYFWGWFSDFRVIWTLLASSLLCLFSLSALILLPDFLTESVMFGIFYMLLVGYDGVRIGRKTMLLNVTTDENRLAFVGAGNTLVGIFLLLSGGLYSFLYAEFTAFTPIFMILVLIAGVVHLKKLHQEINLQENSAQSDSK